MKEAAACLFSRYQWLIKAIQKRYSCRWREVFRQDDLLGRMMVHTAEDIQVSVNDWLIPKHSEVIHNVHTEYITPLCFDVFGMFISYKGQVLLIQIFSIFLFESSCTLVIVHESILNHI